MSHTWVDWTPRWTDFLPWSAVWIKTFSWSCLLLSFSALFSQHIKIQYFPTRTTALPLSDVVKIPNVAGSKYNIKSALTYAVVVLPFGWNLDVLSTSVWFFGQVRTYSGDQTGVWGHLLKVVLPNELGRERIWLWLFESLREVNQTCRAAKGQSCSESSLALDCGV